MKNRMKRGAVDLDGVVAELLNRTVRCAQSDFGCTTPVGFQFGNYDISKDSDITPDIFKQIFAAKGFYRDAELMPHALESLQELRAADYSLHVVTSRPNNEHVVPDTLHWLAVNAVPLDSVHIVTHTTYEAGADAKSIIAKGLDIGWAVEDSPHNARAYAEVCDIVFLQNASYNINEPMPSNVVRINDLRDMVIYLNAEEGFSKLQTNEIGAVSV